MPESIEPAQAESENNSSQYAPVESGGHAAPPPDLAQPAVGTIIDEHYHILSVVGRGGMGCVYRAKNVRNGQIVAIKILHAKHCQDTSLWLRFQQEARTAGTVNHPHAVTIHDFGITTQGVPYLVMDYLEGSSLADQLAESGFLSCERAVSIFIQICAALAHAHQKGIVHRDIKPSNVMLIEIDGNRDYAKLVDFGIAKTLKAEGEEDTMSITTTGGFVGSPAYMSPEQCRGIKVDSRSDVYALGCVMYEVLTGRIPHVGLNPLETINKHINDMPASFKDLVPERHIPRELEAVVFKSLSKDPARRYQTLTEMKTDLEAFQKSSQGNIASNLKAELKLARLTKSPIKAGKKLIPLALAFGLFVAVCIAAAPLTDPYRTIARHHQLRWQAPRTELTKEEVELAKKNTTALIAHAESTLAQNSRAEDRTAEVDDLLKFADRYAKMSLYEEANQLYQRAGMLMASKSILSVNDKPSLGTNLRVIRRAIGGARCDYHMGRLVSAARTYERYLNPMLLVAEELDPLFVFQAMHTCGDVLYDKEEFGPAHTQFSKAMNSPESWATRYKESPRYMLSMSKLADTDRINGSSMVADNRMSEAKHDLGAAMEDYKSAQNFWRTGPQPIALNDALCQYHLAQVAAIANEPNASSLFAQAVTDMEKATHKDSSQMGLVLADYAAHQWKSTDFAGALVNRLRAWLILKDSERVKRDSPELLPSA